MISGGIGRSAVRYEVDADAGFVLGLDLGASTLRASVANIAGAIVRENEIAGRSAGRDAAHRTESVRSRAAFWPTRTSRPDACSKQQWPIPASWTRRRGG
jgi:hypothetical protein